MIGLDPLSSPPRVSDAGEYKYGLYLAGILYGLVCAIRPHYAATTVQSLIPNSNVPAIIFGVTLMVGCVLAFYGSARGFRAIYHELYGLLLLTGQGISFMIWTVVVVGGRASGLMIFLGGLISLPSAVRASRLWLVVWPEGRFARPVKNVSRLVMTAQVRVRAWSVAIRRGLRGRNRRGHG